MPKRIFLLAGAVVIFGIIGAVLLLHSGYPQQMVHSPYISQLSSSVRGLSPQEVDDLLNGRGAGFARTAELNSYPGPRHVLDLQQELDLSADQIRQVEAVFQQMEAQAQQTGREIVERESRFNQGFANKTITEADLQAQTQELAQLYGRLRAIHLQAHLQITPLLSAQQIAEYNELRGYTNPVSPNEHQHQGH